MASIPRARWLIAALVALSFGGCRSCACAEGETTYEKLDGPVKVSVVRQTHWPTSGPVPVPRTDCVLRVEAMPPFDEAIDCKPTQLFEDATGRFIAYRIDGDTRLVRIGGGGRHFRDCAPTLGSGKAPDFTKVDTFVDAAPRILTCEEKPHARAPAPAFWQDLIDELRAVGGSVAVVAFLAKTAPTALANWYDGNHDDDPWTLSIVRLPANERGDVERAICPALADASSTRIAYQRAARFCAFDAPGAGDAAIARLRAAFDAHASDAGDLEGYSTIAWAAIVAARARPAEASALACAALSSEHASSWRVDIALGLVAAARARCAAVARWLDDAPCSADLDCDAGLCGPSEARAGIDGWMREGDAPLDGGVRLSTPRGPGVRVTLAAAYAQGPLSRAFAVGQSRRHYQMDVRVAPTDCNERAEPGAPCKCEVSFDDPGLCKLPLDGGRGALEKSRCSVRANDARKWIGEARHTCAIARGACVQDDDCCPGLVCELSGCADGTESGLAGDAGAEGPAQ